MENGFIVHFKVFQQFASVQSSVVWKNSSASSSRHAVLDMIKLIKDQNNKLSCPLTNSALLARGSRDHHDNMQSVLADTSCLAQADDDKWNSMTLRDSYEG